MKVRATKRALALGGGALALFAVGTNVQAGWVLVIAALLAGVLCVGVIVPLLGSSGIEVGRRVPRTAVAGQHIAATISVTNRSRRTRGLLAVFDEFCGAGSAVVGLLRQSETREYASRRDGARRGVYAGGECTVTSGAPFGVVRTRRTVDVASPIVVYPRTYDVSARDMLGLGAWRATAPIGDASSVRDYHRGDPLRHIHWRSVARRGQLVVREFDTEKRAEVTIVAEAADDADGADAVASVACSLGLSFLRGAGEVRLLTGRGAQIHTSRVRDADSVLEWGARLAPSGVPFTTVLDVAASAPAVVCVCPASTSGAERLSRLAGDTSLLAVLVGSSTLADDLAARVRGAGAAVAVVSPGEVETWFRDGCVAS